GTDHRARQTARMRRELSDVAAYLAREREREFYGDLIWPRFRRGAYWIAGAASFLEARMVFVWARLLVLGGGWLAAAVTALIANSLLGAPELPTFLASGALWTCLLLLQ